MGLEFARGLAARGYDLLLVSNREDQLASASAELSAEFPVKIRTIFQDLAQPKAADELYSRCASEGILPDVRVNDAEIVQVSDGTRKYDGVTTLLTEHNLTVFLDEAKELRIGTPVDTEIFREGTAVVVSGVVTAVRESRRGTSRTHTIEILDNHGNRMEYLQVLYDRIPSLPQSLHGDYGALFDLWQNIAHRVARTMK